MSAPLSDRLAREHAELRAAVIRARRALKPDGLAARVMNAVEEAEGLRAQGFDADTIAQGLEKTIRDAWPKGREEPWQHLCDACEDFGWQIHTCPGDASCGDRRTDGHVRKLIPHYPHHFARACWCEKGRQFQVKPKQETDELVNVGKTSKPSRFGR